jgi:hypothetical protein
MTPNQFRRLALALPDATEGAHGGHPDFRIGGKVFASLGYPDATLGMVKLAPDQQAMLAESAPKVFAPLANAWGLKGYTNVRLAEADAATLKHALRLAWENTAPNKLKAEHARAASGRKTAKSESPARKRSRKTKARA